MRPPAFWGAPRDRPGWRARSLAPLAWLVAHVTARRVARAPKIRPDVPVFCVGNVNLGGTGKTPTVIALVERLVARGAAPFVLMRGHGGSLAGPVRVDSGGHTAADVGDEALLLAAFAPVIVSSDRAAGAALAEREGATVIVMDDGLQNPDVAKDAAIIVVDARDGWGNGRVAPSGPLREPVAAAMARADVLLSIGGPDERSAFAETWYDAIALPHATARLAPLQTGMEWGGLRVLAFAGIGAPAKFFRTLAELGADLVQTVPLSDHQTLQPALLRRLATEADARSLQLVTTEKDAVRLPAAYRGRVLTLPVRLQTDDWGPIDALIDRVLAR